MECGNEWAGDLRMLIIAARSPVPVCFLATLPCLHFYSAADLEQQSVFYLVKLLSFCASVTTITPHGKTLGTVMPEYSLGPNSYTHTPHQCHQITELVCVLVALIWLYALIWHSAGQFELLMLILDTS